MKMQQTTMQTGRRQQGAVLVVALVMLLILTFIGISSMNTANVQAKMVGNLQDQQRAFDMAEIALIAAENWMKGQSSTPQAATDPTPGDNTVWSTGSTQAKVQQSVSTATASWWNYATLANFWTAEGNAVPLSTGVTNGGSTSTSWYVFSAPMYVIEELRAITGSGGTGSPAIGMSDTTVNTTLYRIVARGVGGRADTVILLEEIYGKQ